MTIQKYFRHFLCLSHISEDEKKSLKIMALNQSNPDDCKLLHPLHLTSDFALTECDGFTCFLVRILMHIYVWSKKKSRLYLIMQNYHFLPD